jgi:hypothetical protein
MRSVTVRMTSLHPWLNLRFQIGSPTMLVNNAGVVSGKLILDLEARDVER